MPRILLAVALLLAMARTADARKSAVDFYKELAAAVHQAQGRIVLNVSEGTWRTTFKQKTVIWDVEEGTKIVVVFDYQGGALRSGEIEFRPAVHVWSPKAPSVSGRLSRVTYDSDGDLVDWDLKPDNARATNISRTLDLKRHLELSRTPDAVFLGSPIAGLSKTERCEYVSKKRKGKVKNCKKTPMVTRVRINSDGEKKGLYVQLKDNAVVNFMDEPYASNLVFDSPSTFEFDNVNYEVDEGTISGQLVNLKAKLRSGRLASKNATIRLAQNTQVNLPTVTFSRNSDGTGSIQALGQIEGFFAANSELQLGNDTNSSAISFADAEIKLLGVSATFRVDGSAVLAVGRGSTVSAQLATSTIQMGDGFVRVEKGGILLDIASAEWDSASRPFLTGTLAISDTTVMSGKLVLNTDTAVAIIGGKVIAKSLTVNTESTPPIQGKFDDFRVEIADSQSLQVPGGLFVQTGTDVYVEAKDPDSPLELVNKDPWPIGKVYVKGSFRQLRNSERGAFALHDGTVAVYLRRHRKGEYSGDELAVAGDLKLKTDSFDFVIPVSLRGGKDFLTVKDGSPRAEITWSAKLPRGRFFDYESPFIKGVKDHYDLRVFPLRLSAGLRDDVQLSQGSLVLLGPSFTASASAPATLVLDVPSGCGEKSDVDDPGKGCNPDPNSSAENNQEVFTDTFPACRFHLYIKPQRHELSSKISLTASNGGLTLAVSELQQPTISWDSDGCAVHEIVLDALGWVSKAIGVDIVRGEMQDGVKAFIDHRVREIVKSFGGRLRIQI